MSTQPGKTRADRARQLYQSGAVKPVDVAVGEFEVHSQNGGGWYFVCTVEGAEYCDCPDFQERGNFCKHLQAALIFQTEGKPKIRLKAKGTAGTVDLVDLQQRIAKAKEETALRQTAYHVARSKAEVQRTMENDVAALYG